MEPKPEPELEPKPDTDPVKDCIKADTCPAAKFTDVKMDWTHDGIHCCVENGLMDGVGGGRFDPDGTSARAMLVTVLYRLEGEPKAGECTFSDVPEGEWYTNAVIWAVENKIVEDTNILSFADAEKISSWAKDAMQWAVGAGLINGKGENYLYPTGKATRAEMAAILYRFCENVAE